MPSCPTLRLNHSGYGHAFALLFALALPAAAQLPPAAQAALDSITAGRMKPDVAFLSSEELAGRKTGSKENRIAAAWLASEFQRIGLKPAGSDGTYFQNYNLVSATPDEAKLAISVRRNGLERSLQYSHDFDRSWVPQTNNPSVAEGPVVFLGYGIRAPEYGYDDLAGVDLRGKIAVILSHEPRESDAASKFKGTWNTFHAYDGSKYEVIRQAGAAGVLTIRESHQHRPPDKPSGPHDWDLPGASIALAGPLWDLPAFGITEAAADELLGAKVAELQAGIDRTEHPYSFEVPGVTVRLVKAFTERKLVSARNVIGVLEGSDEKLKGEYVIVSAHYDHSGIVEGRLYPGADDNASGVSALLAIARAYVSSGLRPKRSIAFLSFDSEEQGMLGAFAYGEHPTLPLEKTVANLNMDMIGRDELTPTWPTPEDGNRNSVNIVGTLYSPDLRAAVEQADRGIGLKLDFKTDKSDPEEWFSRSDHFVFAAHAVPSVLFNTGEHPDYHTEHDTADKLNYPKLERIARLVFLTSLAVADSGSKPVFVP